MESMNEEEEEEIQRNFCINNYTKYFKSVEGSFFNEYFKDVNELVD